MNEETDAPEMGGADESAQVETASEATAEQPSGADEAAQADDAGEAAKRVPWFQKRIDEVTAKKYEAEREAAYWRGIAEASGRQQPPQAPPEGPPREDQFETWDEYDQARIEYAVEQKLRARDEQTQRTTVLRTYEERAAKARESKPDYESVVNNPSLSITPIMAEVIRVSEAGPEVAYHLGTNPGEAARIAALPDYLQAAELGRLEARLTPMVQQPAQQRAAPPPPPKTLSGVSAGINKSPSDMSMAEYVAARKAGNI